MESGSNKSLFTLLAVIVFGIFLSLSYFLFKDNLKGVLADVMNKSSVTISQKMEYEFSDFKYKGDNLLVNGDTYYQGSVLGWGPGNEFLRYLDTAPIFDEFGVGIYTISFDLQVTTPGSIQVYMQNGSHAKYTFYKVVQGTTEWKRHSIIVDIFAVDPTNSFYDPTYSYLAFYGTYGTGVSPSVRNVKIEKLSVPGVPVYIGAPSDLTY